MIEEDEIFQSAEETGYRICTSTTPSSSFGRIFSTHWDPNDNDLMVSCSQSGLVRTTRVSSSEVNTYEILFRRFRTASVLDKQDPRNVRSHFDKMHLIPGRPGEFVFLLGISKVLLYTAFPGTNGFVAKSTSSHSGEFAYGSPIMELQPHNARITSVSISHKGNMMASGDEQGNVKIMLLQHFEDIEVLKERMKPGQPTLPENVNVSFKPHTAPVFAVKWLPGVHSEVTMDSGSASASKYGLSLYSSLTAENGGEPAVVQRIVLATSSIDRAVRLWQVTYSSVKGLALIPFMALNTMSTHTLCLESALAGTKPPELLKSLLGLENSTASESGTHDSTKADEAGLDSALQLRSPTKSTFKGGAPISTAAMAARAYKESRGMYSNKGSNDAAHSSDLPEGSTILLGAGTNAGTVYVWKLDPSKFALKWGCSVSGKGSEGTLDDGSNLLSLLHASDKPVVQVAIGCALDTTTAKEKVVLAASDTNGTVRVHAEISEIEDFPATAKNGLSADSLAKLNIGGMSTIEKLSAIQEEEKVETKGSHARIKPLSIVGEAYFSDPVVSCSFPWMFSDQHKWTDRSDLPRTITQRRSGSLGTDDIDDDGSTTTTQWQLEAMNKLESARSSLLGEVVEEIESVENCKRLLVATADGELRHYKAGSLLNLMTSQDAAEAAARSAAAAADSDEEDEPDDESSSDSSSEEDSRASYTSEGSGSFFASGGESLKHIPKMKINKPKKEKKEKKSKDKVNALPVMRPDKTLISFGGGSGTHGTLASGSVTDSGEWDPSPRLIAPAPISNLIGSDVPSHITQVQQQQHTSPLPHGTASVGSYGRVGAGSPSPVPAPTPVATTAATTTTAAAAAVRTQFTTEPDETIPTTAAQVYGKYVSNDGIIQAPTTVFAEPHLNSSRALQGHIRALQHDLENDDVSVSTILTTDSERKLAANTVTNLPLHAQIFASLPRVDEKAVNAITPTLPKISKQIDSRWLERKQYMKPSASDMDILNPRHPSSKIVLTTEGETVHSAGLSLAMAVGALVDNTNIYPEFKLCVPEVFIFGEDASKDALFGSSDSLWQGMEADCRM